MQEETLSEISGRILTFFGAMTTRKNNKIDQRTSKFTAELFMHISN